MTQADVPWWRAMTGGRGRLVAVLLLVALVAVPVGVVMARDDRLPENAALRVEDTVVSTVDLQRRVDVLEALYGVSEPRRKARLDQFRRDVAKAIAVSMILESAARERQIVVAERAARSTLNKVIEREFPGAGRSEFVRALGNVGVSEAEVLDEVQRQMVVSRLFDEVTAGVSVTDEEVAEAYADRRAELVVPQRRRISNIVVAERATAVEVLRRARAGTPFTRLVRVYSLDASTRSSGGDLGLVTRADLEGDYGRAAFRAAPNGVFGPVKTRFGWNVGQVTAVRPAQPMSLADVRDELRQQLETEKALETWRSWVAAQIKETDVEYADAYRPADPDSPPTSNEPGGLLGRPESPSS